MPLGEEGESYSHHGEMAKIEEIGKILRSTQQRLNDASSESTEGGFWLILTQNNHHLSFSLLVKSHLLNVDVVTLFDPVRADQLRSTIQECYDCAERLKERMREVREEFLKEEETEEKEAEKNNE